MTHLRVDEIFITSLQNSIESTFKMKAMVASDFQSQHSNRMRQMFIGELVKINRKLGWFAVYGWAGDFGEQPQTSTHWLVQSYVHESRYILFTGKHSPCMLDYILSRALQKPLIFTSWTKTHTSGWDRPRTSLSTDKANCYWNHTACLVCNIDVYIFENKVLVPQRWLYFGFVDIDLRRNSSHLFLLN